MRCVSSSKTSTAGTCVLRALVGLCGGLLTALYSAALANSKITGTDYCRHHIHSNHRRSNVYVLDCLGIRATGRVRSFHPNGSAVCCFGSISIFFAVHGPVSAPHEKKALPEKRSSWRAYPLLFSFIPFIAVQTGVFTFFGEFGRMTNNLSVDATLRAIGISVILSSRGGSVAAYLLQRSHRPADPYRGSRLANDRDVVGNNLGFPFGRVVLVLHLLLQIGYVFLECYLYSALIDANNFSLVPAATPVFRLVGSFDRSQRDGICAGSRRHDECFGMEAQGRWCWTALLTMPFLRQRAARAPHPVTTS